MARAPALPETERLSLFRQLQRRNRRVDVLRVLVPLLGILVFAVLTAQIYVSSLGSRFGIGQVSVSPDSVSVDAPEYAGLLDDGANYRVSAAQARAATSQPDLINLAEAAVEVVRPSGVRMSAEAAHAQLDTTRQLVLIPGHTDISDSTGTSGTLSDSVFDWVDQVLTAKGPVAIDYADGSTVRAKGLVYDARKRLWTFSGATVTLPATPGESAP